MSCDDTQVCNETTGDLLQNISNRDACVSIDPGPSRVAGVSSLEIYYLSLMFFDSFLSLRGFLFSYRSLAMDGVAGYPGGSMSRK